MPHDRTDTPDHHDHAAHALLPSEPALRVRALETLLLRKGLVDPAALDAILDTYQNRIGPQIGARVVARAWREPAFLEALRRDAEGTLAALGLAGRQGEHVRVVENTPTVHNVVVCTLCSCYPWPLLGIPPGWYKSDAYRARVVREPRAVLAEFGMALPPEQRVAVWDSTAEIRYLVIPMRPPESAGLDEAALARWVTRDSMIGTGLPRRPAPAAAAAAEEEGNPANRGDRGPAGDDAPAGDRAARGREGPAGVGPAGADGDAAPPSADRSGGARP